MAITKLLNERKVSPPYHNKRKFNAWGPSTINHIIQNPMYDGRVEWNKYRYPKLPGTSIKKRIKNPRSEWVCIDRENLRIIDRKVWEAVQPKERDKSITLNRRAKYLLSGLLECGECGGSLVAIPSKG